MSEHNPLQVVFKTCEKVSKCIQTQLSQFLKLSSFNDHYSNNATSMFLQHSELPHNQEKNAGPVTKEELGRATWTFLHTLGAQYPDKPTRQQKKDVKELHFGSVFSFCGHVEEELFRELNGNLSVDFPVVFISGVEMAILSRMYPCKECADHFKEVLRANPVQAGSQADFSQWLCHVHNVVNRSLSKPKFPCDRVDARWGKLDCEQRACDLQGTDTFWP